MSEDSLIEPYNAEDLMEEQKLAMAERARKLGRGRFKEKGSQQESLLSAED